MRELVFLKLGGSLITDKTKPYTVRMDKLGDLANQVARALQTHPDLLLILGHGSGSFGHTAAKKYGTRDGFLSLQASGNQSTHEANQDGDGTAVILL